MVDLIARRLTRSNLATPKSMSVCTCTAAAPAVEAWLRRARCSAVVCNAGQLRKLSDWIRCNGGSVHHALLLSDNAPSGCRGITASQAISLQELEAGPLVTVPQKLQLTSDHTLRIIKQHASNTLAATAADKLSNSQLIAAALAHELQHAHVSWWGPYLQSLPSQPPCPWLITSSQQLEACVQPFRTARGDAAVAGWQEAVKQQRQQMLASSEKVEQLLGHALDITAEQVLLALGHVASRSLTSGSSSGLVPFIDLVNHGAEAMGPMLQLDDSNNLVMTVVPIVNVSYSAYPALHQLAVHVADVCLSMLVLHRATQHCKQSIAVRVCCLQPCSTHSPTLR
eukprot:GHRQ01014499.1.p1 GENE.GHRQ01014499.1~~GHRQ01014499.1.p1  ORF type:complete len:340 (+),score=36.55 GHRQ01014499.1:274-1293(+)